MIKKSQKGITLFIAIVIMSILLFISFAVINITLKADLFASSGADSQYAFYAADSGLECALYWESKESAFGSGTRSSFAAISMNEYSGADTSFPLDQTSSAEGVSWGTPATFNSGSKNTNYANELIFGHAETFPHIDPGSGFTIRKDYQQGFSILNEDKIVSSTGSYNTSFSATLSGGVWVALMATFKAASGNTISFVQSNALLSWPASSGNTLSFNNPSTNGDLIIVTITYDTTGPFVDFMTDNKGNVYRKAATVDWQGVPYRAELWYAQNIIGGGSPITINAHSSLFFPQDINCSGADISTGNAIAGTTTLTQINGGGSGTSDSIFGFDMNQGLNPLNACAIVTVTNNSDGTTDITSRGYNTCNINDPRRVERGIKIKA